MDTFTRNILRNEEFRKLAAIGGHRKYHLEGDALVHTLNVIAEAKTLFKEDSLMVKVAALHDIGKIYTSIRHGEGDWEYPDHARCGSFRGVLCKFIPESDPDFRTVQWFIRNHIKPLFWLDMYGVARREEMDSLLKQPEALADPERCTIKNLAGLALCDIRGSVSAVPQTELEEYLENLRADFVYEVVTEFLNEDDECYDFVAIDAFETYKEAEEFARKTPLDESNGHHNITVWKTNEQTGDTVADWIIKSL